MVCGILDFDLSGVTIRHLRFFAGELNTKHE